VVACSVQSAITYKRNLNCWSRCKNQRCSCSTITAPWDGSHKGTRHDNIKLLIQISRLGDYFKVHVRNLYTGIVDFTYFIVSNFHAYSALLYFNQGFKKECLLVIVWNSSKYRIFNHIYKMKEIYFSMYLHHLIRRSKVLNWLMHRYYNELLSYLKWLNYCCYDELWS